MVHFDRLKPCVTLPEATPLEEIAVQQDEDQGITPSLLTQEEATTTEPLEGNDEPEPLEVEVFRNRPVTEEETTTLTEPAPEGITEPQLLPVECRNPAGQHYEKVQPSRKSNRRHKKPERFGHNIYD